MKKSPFLYDIWVGRTTIFVSLLIGSFWVTSFIFKGWIDWPTWVQAASALSVSFLYPILFGVGFKWVNEYEY